MRREYHKDRQGLLGTTESKILRLGCYFIIQPIVLIGLAFILYSMGVR